MPPLGRDTDQFVGDIREALFVVGLNALDLSVVATARLSEAVLSPAIERVEALLDVSVNVSCHYCP